MGGGNLSMVLHPTQGEVTTLLVASCRGDRDKFRPGELIGSNICLTFFFFTYQLPGKNSKESYSLSYFYLATLIEFSMVFQDLGPLSRISSNAQNPGQPSLHRDSVGFAKIKKKLITAVWKLE